MAMVLGRRMHNYLLQVALRSYSNKFSGFSDVRSICSSVSKNYNSYFISLSSNQLLTMHCRKSWSNASSSGGGVLVWLYVCMYVCRFIRHVRIMTSESPQLGLCKLWGNPKVMTMEVLATSIKIKLPWPVHIYEDTHGSLRLENTVVIERAST